MRPLPLLCVLFCCATGCSDDGSSSGAAGGASSGGASSGGAAGSGGAGGGAGSGGAASNAAGPWSAQAVKVDAIPALWGAQVAQESGSRAYLSGGLASTGGSASTKVLRVEQKGDQVVVTSVADAVADRYCGCALVDAKRGELVVIGGRDGNFTETATAELVDLASGKVSPLAAGGAADHPVGCHAVFLADRDEGYVFGGASQSSGFGDTLYRYSPTDHSFTKVEVDGPPPPARYDGAFRYPAAGGPIYLVSGMGAGQFYGDVWTYDPPNKKWSELVPQGAKPPGRRLPWVTFAGDGSALVMAFGSDSPMGQSMLGDLWRLDLTTKAWSQPGFAGTAPPLRGFAQWLPGPEGTAGLLSGGLGEMGMVTEQQLLRPPTPSGGWR
ncbi:MAG: hypothetical protein HYZ29_20345 [Myxococcales bacterium]|nr:hypothetical protein [Myxococcales bacterium]